MATYNYEVYYFQGGRWHVHARYETNEKEEAIEEAKSVESKLGFPARVIRETFHPETNTTEELVAYQGTRAKNIADADSMFGSQPAGGQSSGPAGGRDTRLPR